MQDIIEFTNQNIWLVSGLVASGLAVIFYELRTKARSIGSLSTALAVKAINNGTAVVDVRPTEQFSSGHIVAARNIPADSLGDSKDKLAANKNGTVLVCDNGQRSAECAAMLRKQGLDNVFSLKGGILAWQQENLPLVAGGS
jgi:rhodanese-related sulfurtransferase